MPMPTVSHLLGRSGFWIIKGLGGWNGEPFDAEGSQRMIVVAGVAH
ncbi:MAG: hypothetical protein O3B84_05195 [Chloroflexi bacterium]|nr:hypothetical protein [Chloroflexota bacterium]